LYSPNPDYSLPAVNCLYRKIPQIVQEEPLDLAGLEKDKKVMEVMDTALVKGTAEIMDIAVYIEVMDMAVVKDTVEIMEIAEIMDVTVVKGTAEIMDIAKIMDRVEVKGIAEIMDIAKIMDIVEVKGIAAIMDIVKGSHRGMDVDIEKWVCQLITR